MEEIILLMLEIIFVYPGAFVRWILFYRKSKKIKEVAMDDMYKNSAIGACIFFVLIGIVYTLGMRK